MGQAKPHAAERETARGGARGIEQATTQNGPLPPQAQLLVSLQQTAGNRAVRSAVQRSRDGSRGDAGPLLRAIVPAAGTAMVQRAFLDQKDKKEAVQNAVLDLLGDVEDIDEVLKALEVYEKLTGGKGDALESALSTLISAAQKAKEGLNGSQVVHILDDLEKEASSAHMDVVKTDGFLHAAKDPRFTGNSELIADARREVKSMMAKYGTKTGKSSQQALYDFIVTANDELAGVERDRIKSIGANEYNYGDKETGEISKETQDYLHAFGAITTFLANKALVLQHLQPLAEPVNKETSGKLNAMLAALKQELGRKESQAGFGVPKVPLGILPGEVFVSLLRDGTVLDDFGAGLQHGELSHRIQWYAIIDYMENEGKSVPALEKYTALDLFKQINKEGFSPNRQGNTMWGMVLDKGTSASSDTYSAPGTLNRDLLEASPKFKAEGIGLAERSSTYKSPDTKGLESIGEALIELRTMRIKQAEGLGGLEGRLWQQYGIPTPGLAGKIEKEMSEGGGYEVSDQGTSDEGKEWKVLQEVK